MNEDIFSEYLKKAASFCAYQERTQAEVRERLKLWQIYGAISEQIIGRLIEENFINEERFAKAFAGGKFRVKHWGKNKIKYELRGRGLSDYNIKVALNEIDAADYQKTLETLIAKKKKEFVNDKISISNAKIAKFLNGKGYESGLIWQMLANN